jgi:hypothetical protein
VIHIRIGVVSTHRKTVPLLFTEVRLLLIPWKSHKRDISIHGRIFNRSENGEYSSVVYHGKTPIEKHQVPKSIKRALKPLKKTYALLFYSTLLPLFIAIELFIDAPYCSLLLEKCFIATLLLHRQEIECTVEG